MTDLVPWLRASDARALALTLYGEARSEPIEGRIAVASVIRNRAMAHYRGTTIAAVCLWPAQFSCWAPRGGQENHAHRTAVATALAEGTTPPWSELERALYAETCWVVEGVLAGSIRDRVAGATHYVTERLFLTAPPSWADGQQPICRVGHHVFFRGIR